MGITRYINEAERDFEIFGELEDGWEEFKKDVDYQGFLVRRKF